MGKVKPFVGYTVFAPHSWVEALGEPHQVRQIDVLLFALSKADVGPLLEDRGNNSSSEMRLARGGLSTPWEKLIEAGVIDPAKVGAYLMAGHQDGKPVLRAETDGSFTLLGHWRYARGGMQFDPATERDASPVEGSG